MNVEIGTEAARFPEKEYKNGISCSVGHLPLNVIKLKHLLLNI